jgi:sulfite exporter TauE/SafE|tara:strand:+ start:2334 stop:2576 length:243 start_codon:yes stop_codon:yes gene_type:complete
MSELTDEQKAQKVVHFRRIVKGRILFGWTFTIVGAILFGVGFKNNQSLLIMLNGLTFTAWGLFMVWQAKRALFNLTRSKR